MLIPQVFDSLSTIFYSSSNQLWNSYITFKRFFKSYPTTLATSLEILTRYSILCHGKVLTYQ